MPGTAASPVRPSPLNSNASSRIPLNPLSPTGSNSAGPNGTSARGMPYYEQLREDLRRTLVEKSKLESQLGQIEDNIYALEDAYLSSTSAAGNIVVGFEGYMKAAATSHAPVAPIPESEPGIDGIAVTAPTPYTGTFPVGAALLTGGLLTAGLSTAGLGNITGGRKPKILEEHRIFSNASVSWTQAKASGADGVGKDASGTNGRKESLTVTTSGPALTAKQLEAGLETARTNGTVNGDTPVTARPKKGNKRRGKRDLPVDEEEGSIDGKGARPGKRLKISFSGGGGGAG